ncbi:Rhamnose-binding lectin [Anabarilius grahami]|uniref:Rhamnose-binding lectin n=1 Tax=Anabarilius grahami TaxID=495550 RepID=A0A3N0Y5A4_ANAGA|nr:Rhamnose-binding lectin [Anabarilius grahami]
MLPCSSSREFLSFPLVHTFNMLTLKLSGILLLLILCQHGIDANVICQGRSGILSCNSGSIRVIEATYGRSDRTTCAYRKPASQITNTNCRAPVTNIVSSRNQENSIHDTWITSDVTSFPLVHTFNMLTLKLSGILLLLILCQHGLDALSICEGRSETLSCSRGSIRIIRATYGRSDRTTCAFGKPTSQTTNTLCRAPVTNIVSSRIPEFLLVHTFNMLTLKLSGILLLLILCQHGIDALAICEGRSETLRCSIDALAICEGRSETLRCSRGSIRIIRATYGRSDRTTCAYEKPASQISNTRCRAPVTNIVSSRTERLSECGLDSVDEAHFIRDTEKGQNPSAVIHIHSYSMAGHYRENSVCVIVSE